MVSTSNRKLKKDTDRRYMGEREGAQIVQWLNAPGEADGKKRFAALLKQLNGLDSAIAQYRADPDEDVDSLVALKVNGALNQYAYRISVIADPDEVFRVSLVPVESRRAEAPRVGEIVSYQMPWEPVMTQALMLTLWPLGRADRIRQCKQCDRWLFARTSLQEFCKDTDCRRKHRESSDSFKASRRTYMKKYYENLFGPTARNRRAKAKNRRSK